MGDCFLLLDQSLVFLLIKTLLKIGDRIKPKLSAIAIFKAATQIYLCVPLRNTLRTLRLKKTY